MTADLRTVLSPPYFGLPFSADPSGPAFLVALPQPDCDDTPWRPEKELFPKLGDAVLDSFSDALAAILEMADGPLRALEQLPAPLGSCSRMRLIDASVSVNLQFEPPRSNAAEARWLFFHSWSGTSSGAAMGLRWEAPYSRGLSVDNPSPGSVRVNAPFRCAPDGNSCHF